MGDELSQSAVPFAERDDSVQALLFHRPNKSFCMRVTVRSADGRLDNVDTRGAQESEHRAAPFSIAITDQHRGGVENTVDVVGEMPHGLQHESLVWVRRGTNDVHPSGFQFDHKQGVVRGEPTDGPHFSGEEVRRAQCRPLPVGTSATMWVGLGVGERLRSS